VTATTIIAAPTVAITVAPAAPAALARSRWPRRPAQRLAPVPQGRSFRPWSRLELWRDRLPPLQRPPASSPRGYRWVRNGNDALLIGITSGVIASVIAGNF
jgi:Ni/Co efflux regulator RcnB